MLSRNTAYTFIDMHAVKLTFNYDSGNTQCAVKHDMKMTNENDMYDNLILYVVELRGVI